jgi:hypothetical protein
MRLAGLVAGAAIAAAGCHGDPASELDDRLEHVHSRVAAAEMATDAWLRGSVPTRYTRNTVARASRAVRKEATELAETDAGVLARRTGSAAEIAALALALDELAAAVGREDRDAVGAGRRRLADVEGRLAARRAAGGDSS